MHAARTVPGAYFIAGGGKQGWAPQLPPYINAGLYSVTVDHCPCFFTYNLKVLKERRKRIASCAAKSPTLRSVTSLLVFHSIQCSVPNTGLNGRPKGK